MRTLEFSALLALSALSYCVGFLPTSQPPGAGGLLSSTAGTKSSQQSNSQLFAAATATASTKTYQVTIGYCPGCKWGLRSFWMAQELLSTFQNDDALECVTIVALRDPAPAGSFLVKCFESRSEEAPTILWDRAEKGGFPEMKELKQLVRDQIDPDLFLGHSDREDRKDCGGPASEKQNVERGEEDTPPVIVKGTVAPHVAIAYCTGCRWLLRAGYLGLELTSTFSEEINSISLIPSRPPAKGGKFTVELDDEVLWDRSEKKKFPPVPELKQLIRDRIVPSKDLGHSDVKKSDESDEETFEMDDDESEEARKFFGVA